MGNTFDYSDATDYSSKTHCNASSTGREDAVKLALVQGKKVHDKFCFILNSNITNSNDTWGTSKHISKGDTSVTRLKNSNKQESFIQKNDEVDSIYEKNLKDVFQREGTLKEGMNDEASAIDGGLNSPRDYVPFPLAEVDTKSLKGKPASKKLGKID